MLIRPLGNILFNSFIDKLNTQDEESTKVTFQHFKPFNHWEEIRSGVLHLNDGTFNYDFEEKSHARWRSLGLFIASPMIQPFGLFLNIVNRIVKIVTFAHLWHASPRPITFKARSCEMGKDILRVTLTPFAYLAFIFVAFYGILRPYDGRKLYATFERAIYGGGAETFETERHAPVRSFLSDKFHPW